MGFSKNADALFEAYQVFRHELWKSQPKGERLNFVVSAYPPSLNHSGMAFPRCEKIEEPEQQ